MNIEDAENLERLEKKLALPPAPKKQALMLKIAEGGKFWLSPETCEEVCAYLVFYAKKGAKPLDLRLLDNAFNDRLMYDRGESQTHWKDMLVSRIDAQIVEPKITPRTRQARLVDERDIAKQIYDKFPDSREDRFREWKERVGRSERALYRRAAELGLDAPPRFLSTEDLEDFAQASRPFLAAHPTKRNLEQKCPTGLPSRLQFLWR